MLGYRIWSLDFAILHFFLQTDKKKKKKINKSGKNNQKL
jgi:hypothetical protein